MWDRLRPAAELIAVGRATIVCRRRPPAPTRRISGSTRPDQASLVGHHHRLHPVAYADRTWASRPDPSRHCAEPNGTRHGLHRTGYMHRVGRFSGSTGTEGSRSRHLTQVPGPCVVCDPSDEGRRPRSKRTRALSAGALRSRGSWLADSGSRVWVRRPLCRAPALSCSPHAVPGFGAVATASRSLPGLRRGCERRVARRTARGGRQHGCCSRTGRAGARGREFYRSHFHRRPRPRRRAAGPVGAGLARRLQQPPP